MTKPRSSHGPEAPVENGFTGADINKALASPEGAVRMRAEPAAAMLASTLEVVSRAIDGAAPLPRYRFTHTARTPDMLFSLSDVPGRTASLLAELAEGKLPFTQDLSGNFQFPLKDASEAGLKALSENLTGLDADMNSYIDNMLGVKKTESLRNELRVEKLRALFDSHPVASELQEILKGANSEQSLALISSALLTVRKIGGLPVAETAEVIGEKLHLEGRYPILSDTPGWTGKVRPKGEFPLPRIPDEPAAGAAQPLR